MNYNLSKLTKVAGGIGYDNISVRVEAQMRGQILGYNVTMEENCRLPSGQLFEAPTPTPVPTPEAKHVSEELADGSFWHNGELYTPRKWAGNNFDSSPSATMTT